MAIPIHEGHGIAFANAERFQGIGQLPKALEELPLGQARMVAIDDFLIRCRTSGRMEQLLDEQGISVG